MDNRQVIALLARQDWIASRSQLTALGVPTNAIARAVRSGMLRRLLPGVYGLAGRSEAFEARARAVHLALDGAGFLSGVTAAHLYGVRGMPLARIEATVPQRSGQAFPGWVRLVRTSWDDDEVAPPRPDGLVLASPARMLFGLASQLTEFRFARAAEDAWHRHLIDPVQARRYLQRVRRRGRTGVAVFEAWLEHAEGRGRPSQSGLEMHLLRLVTEAGLPEPQRQFPLRLRSGELIHLDFAWPDLLLAVEPGHSWWHGGDLRMRADQARDRACSELGWLVVRLDESMMANQHETARQLRAIHARRRAMFDKPPPPPAA